MLLRSGIARPISLLLAALAAAGMLTGCGLQELAHDCEGTDDRVKEIAALDILDSRPAGATVAPGSEKVDAGCWADSGDVSLYAGRTYVSPGTRAEVAAHYRTVAKRDGWDPDPGGSSGDLCFVKEEMSLRVAFLTAEDLAKDLAEDLAEDRAEDGDGSRPDLPSGAGYSVNVDSYVHSGEASC
ncbi:hypothetical protein OKJ48_11390 [Streptomyces kunmingensis]|uniref:Lipoprotein n=1 Tax=Streptomyces kunmingensis TaxID=68225 RepID=A0ABU6C9K0_9ACTN|nr:hypothetical protein [Streptomyces kunmingensis]MEB3960842.1 hypothetical protein [Streptomyces kunmingensis]